MLFAEAGSIVAMVLPEQILASSVDRRVYYSSTSPQHRVEVSAHRWGESELCDGEDAQRETAN